MTRLALAIRLLLLAACLLASGRGGASARPLEMVTAGGSLALCAHPNAMPFASRTADPPGLQIEIAEAIARRLGVSLVRHWVVNSFQYRRAGCDIVLDAIGNKDALSEVGLQMSRPYYRSGVTLAARRDSTVATLDDLSSQRQVGVLVGSLAAMKLGQKGVTTSPYMFEEDMLNALYMGEIEAAAVTPAAIGWFNMQHPGAALRRIRVLDAEPELSWNVVVGMLSPDDKLRQSIDAALSALISDGTIARAYGRYGIEFRTPE
jgi:polar amino acid transport system substrate-binding protein